MTRSADASSILIDAAAESERGIIAVIARPPSAFNVSRRFGMLHLLIIRISPADRVTARAMKNSRALARLDSVAHEAEARKGLLPLVTRGAGDDSHGVSA